jgi:hypothetical protein
MGRGHQGSIYRTRGAGVRRSFPELISRWIKDGIELIEEIDVDFHFHLNWGKVFHKSVGVA